MATEEMHDPPYPTNWVEEVQLPSGLFDPNQVQVRSLKDFMAEDRWGKWQRTYDAFPRGEDLSPQALRAVNKVILERGYFPIGMGELSQMGNQFSFSYDRDEDWCDQKQKKSPILMLGSIFGVPSRDETKDHRLLRSRSRRHRGVAIPSLYLDLVGVGRGICEMRWGRGWHVYDATGGSGRWEPMKGVDHKDPWIPCRDRYQQVAVIPSQRVDFSLARKVTTTHQIMQPGEAVSFPGSPEIFYRAQAGTGVWCVGRGDDWAQWLFTAW